MALNIYQPPAAPDVVYPFFTGLKTFGTDYNKLRAEAYKNAAMMRNDRQQQELRPEELKYQAAKRKQELELMEARSNYYNSRGDAAVTNADSRRPTSEGGHMDGPNQWSNRYGNGAPASAPTTPRAAGKKVGARLNIPDEQINNASDLPAAVDEEPEQEAPIDTSYAPIPEDDEEFYA